MITSSFRKWAVEHNRRYSSFSEEFEAYRNFIVSYKHVKIHSKGSTYKITLNKFSDKDENYFSAPLYVNGNRFIGYSNSDNKH